MMQDSEKLVRTDAMDLGSIKAKLMHKTRGEGWDQERADAVELEYRRFLYLVQQFPNEDITPQMDVDTFWHYHILDTVKYSADCEQLFGYFLHHVPDPVDEDSAQRAARERAGERMQHLYEATFGQSAPSFASRNEELAKAAFCGIAGESRRPGAATELAFCGVTSKTAQESTTAFCGIAAGAPHTDAGDKNAFCGIARRSTGAGQHQAAFCGIASGSAQATRSHAAFCGISRERADAPKRNLTAFCGIAREAVPAVMDSRMAFCGIAN